MKATLIMRGFEIERIVWIAGDRADGSSHESNDIEPTVDNLQDSTCRLHLAGFTVGK
jgi:hypothetical protein